MRPEDFVYILLTSIVLKTFEGKMFIRRQTTTPPQILFEVSLYLKVIFENMREADDTF